MKRPIQYADMNAVADFDSQTYPTEKWLREWIAGTAVRKGERGEKTALRQHGPNPSGRPYVANEYAHAMGNSTGNFAEYWEVFDSEPRMAGGFVWEWVEHGILSRDALGRVRVAKFPDPRTWLYGGDFGDMPNGGNFCCDGLVRADRTANPGLAEVSYVQQPLSVNMVNGEIELTNRRYFTSLTPLRNRIGWRLLVDGRQVSAGETNLPGKIAPRAKWMQRFEDVRRLCNNVKGEKVLRVSLLENGAVIAECEALIASGMPELLPTSPAGDINDMTMPLFYLWPAFYVLSGRSGLPPLLELLLIALEPRLHRWPLTGRPIPAPAGCRGAAAGSGRVS